MKLSGEQIAEEVLRLRLSQILVNEEYKAGKFKIPVHLAMGHEAVAVALNHVLEEGDRLVLSHRNIEFNLARLGKLRPVLDEYLLKPTGLAGGKLGSMNLVNPSRGIIYTSSILGNNFPVAAGLAMAEKVTERNGAVFVLGGDGSIEEGSFYENLLNAKTWGLGLIFIIENNEWSLGTHITERRCPIDIEKLAGSVGISYLQMKGNEVEKYIETFRSTRERALKEKTPICIEVMVKTLGDRHADDGRYINYHAGPSPVVDILKHAPLGGILRETEEDPVFVVQKEIGKEKLLEIGENIMKDLQKELA